MHLKVSQSRALDILGWNPNEKFLNAIGSNWRADDDGTIDGTSVCWLLCWAKAEGRNNEAAAHEARRAFEAIIDTPLDRLDTPDIHEWAQRTGRYGVRAAVDAELARLLG